MFVPHEALVFVRLSRASSTSEPARSTMKVPKRPRMISNCKEGYVSRCCSEEGREREAYVASRPNSRLGHCLYEVRSGQQKNTDAMSYT